MEYTGTDTVFVKGELFRINSFNLAPVEPREVSGKFYSYPTIGDRFLIWWGDHKLRITSGVVNVQKEEEFVKFYTENSAYVLYNIEGGA